MCTLHLHIRGVGLGILENKDNFLQIDNNERTYTLVILKVLIFVIHSGSASKSNK